MARRVTPSGRPQGHRVEGSPGRCCKNRQSGSKGSALGGSRAAPWPYFPSRLAGAENGHEVYRARQEQGAPTLRYRKLADRRSRRQRWRDAVAELLEMQDGYQAWLATLPENLADSTTADALRLICDLNLEELASVEPPRGFGRD